MEVRLLVHSVFSSIHNKKSEAQIRTLAIVLCICLLFSFFGFAQSYDNKGKLYTNPSNFTNGAVTGSWFTETNGTGRFLSLQTDQDLATNLLGQINSKLGGTLAVSGSFSFTGGFTETNGTAHFASVIALQRSQTNIEQLIYNFMGTNVLSTNIAFEAGGNLATIAAAAQGQTNRQATAQTQLNLLALESSGNLDKITAAGQGNTNRMQTLQTSGWPVTNGATAFTVQPGNTTNSSPWYVLMNNPTGAATAANQQSQTNNEATMITILQGMTNYAAPYSRFNFWNPSAAISSNIVVASAATVGNITVLNTNNNTIRFMVYDSTGTGALLGTAPQWGYDVPFNGTNSAGFVLPIPGGQRFSNGVTYTATKGGTTNTAPDGPLIVNTGWKP